MDNKDLEVVKNIITMFRESTDKYKFMTIVSGHKNGHDEYDSFVSFELISPNVSIKNAKLIIKEEISGTLVIMTQDVKSIDVSMEDTSSFCIRKITIVTKYNIVHTITMSFAS